MTVSVVCHPLASPCSGGFSCSGCRTVRSTSSSGTAWQVAPQASAKLVALPLLVAVLEQWPNNLQLHTLGAWDVSRSTLTRE